MNYGLELFLHTNGGVKNGSCNLIQDHPKDSDWNPVLPLKCLRTTASLPLISFHVLSVISWNKYNVLREITWVQPLCEPLQKLLSLGWEFNSGLTPLRGIMLNHAEYLIWISMITQRAEHLDKTTIHEKVLWQVSSSSRHKESLSF